MEDVEDDRGKRYESLQAALDLIDQGFTLIDQDLRMVAWNKTFFRLLDFPPEMGYLGAPFESFMRYNAERGEYGPGDPERYVEERVRAARTFQPHEIERTRPNGTVLRVRGVPVPGHGFVTLYSDITAQRNAERQIREHNAELESRVAERTAMLVQAQKMEALGHLTGGLAHDFNNILTVVLGNLSALTEARRTDPAVAEFVQPALEAARRGAELIKGLLSFSREQPLQAQAADAAALIASVARLVRRSLPENLQLHIGTGDAPLAVWIDSHQLQNTLLNLILNARDAAQMQPQGRIAVQARAQALEGAVAAERQVKPGRYVLIEVIDDGAGMDAATLERVFEPFFTTKRPGLGTGLGMAMVESFVRQSGGAIAIRSRVGQGTTVSMWLPASDAPVSTGADAELDETPARTNRGLALLVEDDAQVRTVVRRMLLELGFAVLEAENGVEATQILDQTPGIALMLTDVVMPGGIDGRVLAAHASQRGVPHVVLMSGYAPDLGPPAAHPMLAKPFTRAQLAALLDGAAA